MYAREGCWIQTNTMIPAEAAFEHWMSDEDLEQEITEHYLSTAKVRIPLPRLDETDRF